MMLSVAAQNQGTKQNIEKDRIQFTTASWNEILATAKKRTNLFLLIFQPVGVAIVNE